MFFQIAKLSLLPFILLVTACSSTDYKGQKFPETRFVRIFYDKIFLSESEYEKIGEKNFTVYPGKKSIDVDAAIKEFARTIGANAALVLVASDIKDSKKTIKQKKHRVGIYKTETELKLFFYKKRDEIANIKRIEKLESEGKKATSTIYIDKKQQAELLRLISSSSDSTISQDDLKKGYSGATKTKASRKGIMTQDAFNKQFNPDNTEDALLKKYNNAHDSEKTRKLQPLKTGKLYDVPDKEESKYENKIKGIFDNNKADISPHKPTNQSIKEDLNTTLEREKLPTMEQINEDIEDIIKDVKIKSEKKGKIKKSLDKTKQLDDNIK